MTKRKDSAWQDTSDSYTDRRTALFGHLLCSVHRHATMTHAVGTVSHVDGGPAVAVFNAPTMVQAVKDCEDYATTVTTLTRERDSRIR